jgi:RNA recognition motif-containing protein
MLVTDDPCDVASKGLKDACSAGEALKCACSYGGDQEDACSLGKTAGTCNEGDFGELSAADAAANSGAKGAGDPGKRTVIASNLPPDLHWKALRKAFSGVGIVELCLVADGITQLTYSTIDSALKAVETYDEGMLNGHCIAVKLNDGSRAAGGRRGGKKTLLVTNVPAGVHWRNLKSAFSVAGRVEVCRLKDGRAEITFRTAAAAEEAVVMYHGGDLNGNRIAVRFFDCYTGCVLLA